MWWITASFLLTAAIYAAVGFGGGSTYTALLVLAGTDYRLVPVISLLCNLIVVAGGTLAFWRAGLLRRELALPLTLASVPMAWLGGFTPIDRETFLVFLGWALTIAGLCLLTRLGSSTASSPRTLSAVRLWTIGPVLGGLLGFLSGLVGIGGGIFLAPALHLSGVAPAKTIAATASFFILVNSLAGLAGQWFKLEGEALGSSLLPYGWLLLAVLVGGQIGNRAGIRVLSGRLVRRVTGVLVLAVGLRVLWSWVTE